MNHHEMNHQPDYGTGQKKLGLYLMGVIACIILTVIAFWAVMSERFSKLEIITIIFSAACIQFFVQVICFLRLSTQTEQGKTNVMTFIFTGVILLCFVVGSLWIMNNLNYYATN
jgi:cytochrome o ubiquinol oxidase operon protein cyoD